MQERTSYMIMTQDEGDALYVAARIQLQRMSEHDPRRPALSAALSKFRRATYIEFGEDDDTQDEQITLQLHR
jgi:hypothetical protein